MQRDALAIACTHAAADSPYTRKDYTEDATEMGGSDAME
jgi:hypothetical protein